MRKWIVQSVISSIHKKKTSWIMAYNLFEKAKSENFRGFPTISKYTITCVLYGLSSDKTYKNMKEIFLDTRCCFIAGIN